MTVKTFDFNFIIYQLAAVVLRQTIDKGYCKDQCFKEKPRGEKGHEIGDRKEAENTGVRDRECK